MLFSKNSILEKLLYQLKYKGQKQLGTYFVTLLGQELKSSINYQAIDAIIPVPLHRKRGYNQVSLFGKAIAHHLEVPFIENALYRTRNTKKLTKNWNVPFHSRWFVGKRHTKCNSRIFSAQDENN